MLIFHRVDKKMVKKARQQEKQGTAPNSQTFQTQESSFQQKKKDIW